MTGRADLLMVFTKPAVAGSVKTRLSPPLTPEQAAAFQMASLDDTIARLRNALELPVEIFLSEEGPARAELERRYAGLPVRLQEGADLGERLVNAFRTAFARGHDRALALGSDHPTLPLEYVTRALSALDGSDVALGPSRDGGYYLVGLRRESWPGAAAIFDDIPWSTATVLDRTLERVDALGLDAALLPEWYDVDRPADLERVGRDAAEDSRVRRFLSELPLP